MPRLIKVDSAKRRGHRTLNSAVKAASPGDQIHVAPGIYAEPVVLDRRVRLTAAPGTVTVEARNAFSLHLLPAAAGSTISGLHLRAQDGHTTVKVEAPAARLDGCVIESWKVEALWVVGPGQVYLEGCRVSSAMSAAMNVRDALAALRSCALSAPGGVGMAVAGAQISLDGCSFVGIGRNALYLETGVQAAVRRCTFRDGQADFPSIWVGAQGDVTVDCCEFEGLTGDAVRYSAGAVGRVESCTFRSLGGHVLQVVDGATVVVRDLSACDVEKTVVLVESGGRVELAGASIGGEIVCALGVQKDSQADVTDLEVMGNSMAAIFVAAGRLTLARTTVRRPRHNALYVFDGGTCRATALLIDSGELDFPLVAVWPDSSLSIASSTIRGGAENAIHYLGTKLELTDVIFDSVGGTAVQASGVMAAVDRCSAKNVGVGIEASKGCRVSVSTTEIDGGDHGVVARDKAIVRLTDTTLRRSRMSGVLIEGAKAVLTSTCVEDSDGDGIMVGDGAEVEFRGVEIRGSAGVGLRSTTPLTFDSSALDLHDNAKGNLEWPGRSARGADRSVDEIIEELELLVGLANVKKKIRSLVNIIRLRQREADLGRSSEPVTLHAVFTGPPGTGKTTVARLYGELLHAMGFLDSGRFFEVTRADLVVGFIGQTATKTRHKFTEAMGGVLFIDEAYSLSQVGGSYTDFGEEAINELVPLMENHRREIAVIVAGYTNEMAAFLDTNPGLKSRFAGIIEFPSYSNDELMEILRRSLARQNRTATPEAMAAAAEYFAALPRDRDFANGRETRRLLDAVVEAIANRAADSGDFSEEALSTVEESDVRVAVAGLSA